jgi:hypothetical protein
MTEAIKMTNDYQTYIIVKATCAEIYIDRA